MPDAGGGPSQFVADLVATVVVVLAFGAALVVALNLSFRAGLMPRFAAGLGVAAGVAHLVLLLVRRSRAPARADGPRDGPRDAPRDGPRDGTDEPDELAAELDPVYTFASASGRSWLTACGYVLGFFVVLYVAGLYVTAVAFALAYLRFEGKRSWLYSVIYAVVIGGALYLIFDVALAVQVPEGLLELS